MRHYHYSEVTPETARQIRLERAGNWQELDCWIFDQSARRKRRERKKVSRWRQRHQGALRRFAVEEPAIYAEIAYGLEAGVPPGRYDPLCYAILVRLGRKAAEMIVDALGPDELSEIGERLVQGIRDGLASVSIRRRKDGLVADPTWVQTPDGPRIVEVSLCRKDITP